MSYNINKGPDYTPSQWTAAAAGFFLSGVVAEVLVRSEYLSRNWAVVLIAIGLGAPPAIVKWWSARKRNVH